MTEALLKDGDVSKLEALRAKRQVTELEARISAEHATSTARMPVRRPPRLRKTWPQ
jgi:hypothetical protein